ncbi:glycosyltransferase family 2 protein [bacterium]|nr:glycosyltransferase family 2 protein [bacterium]
MEIPVVSVIIPNYNHAPYLKQRIESVLAQTYQNFEVILLDDASIDKSRKIIRVYANHPRVRHTVCNEENSGSAFQQWVRGMDLAAGKYLWIAESDDWAAPGFLEKLVPLLETHPNVGVAYCKSWIVDKKSRTIGDTSGWTKDLDENRWESDFINNGQDEIKNYLIHKNTILSASAVLFRRTVLDKIKPIATDYRLCGDWLHWIKMLSCSDVAYVVDKLNYWRENTSNARMKSPGTLEWLEGEGVLRQAAEIAELDEPETTKVLFAFLQQCWQWQKDYIDGLSKKNIK